MVDGCWESEISRASFIGKTVTMGSLGAWRLAPSGAGPAITVRHGLVQVEREGSKPYERLSGDTVDDAKGSMPSASIAGGCNGGASAGPLAKIVW